MGAASHQRRARGEQFVPLILLLTFLGAHFALALTHGPSGHSIPTSATTAAPCAATATHDHGTGGIDLADQHMVFQADAPDHEHDATPHGHPDFDGTMSGRSAWTDLRVDLALWPVLAGLGLVVALAARPTEPPLCRSSWSTRPSRRRAGTALLLLTCTLRT